MSRGVRFEPEASGELDEAADWYEHRATGLGTKFLSAVDQTLALVTRWPQAAPLATDMPNDLIIRRAPVHEFPYRVVYLQTPAADSRRPQIKHRLDTDLNPGTTKKFQRLEQSLYADSARWLNDRITKPSTTHPIATGHASCSYSRPEARMDDGRIGGEMTLAGIAKQLEKIQSNIAAVQSDVAAVRSDIKTVDGKVDSLDHRMMIEFEETRRVINLGFENTQMLREEVGRRFDDTDRAHADHKAVLEAAIIGLSRATD